MENLHTHTTHSYMSALSTLEELAEKSLELGLKHLAITDFMNVSGHKDLERVCKNTGLKPIYGCELHITDDKSYKSYNYNNLIALAKTQEGYKNLLKLVSAGWTEKFYARARVDLKEIRQFREGIVFILPTFRSPLWSMKESSELAGEEFRRLEKICGELWIEVNALTHPAEFSDSIYWWRLVADNNLYDKTLLSTDVRCHNNEHYDVLESLFCLRDRKVLSDENHYKPGPDHHLKSEDELKKILEESYNTFNWKRTLENTDKLAGECSVELPTTDSVKFRYSGDKLELMRLMIEEGIVDRNLQHSVEFDERLEYELKLVKEKGFIDYFLVIRDLIKHAKDSGIIVGPARGSAAGSLVCYLLHIVDINPLKYGLMFERFIDVNRTDMPDIDIDFQDDRRDEVKAYLVEKYGEDKVGTLMTTMTFKGKMCLQDLGRVGEVPRDKTVFIKDQIIERSGGDSRAGFTIEDALASNEKIRVVFDEFPILRQAQVLEGRYRQFGQHAAGVVISNEPLTDIVAFYQRAGQRIVSITGKEAESYGLLKIDLLGLNTLTVLDKTLKLIEKTSGLKLCLQDIPLNDATVYESFPDKYTLSSIFQMDGSAVQQVFKDLAPKNFHELAAVNALGRPGPLHSGSTTKYILRKSGKEKVEYTHECLKPILEESYGVTIYQEQVMRIMREIGEFSWADTNMIRKVMSKRTGVEFFNKFYEKFLVGAKDKMDKATIDEIWNNTCTFGSWAFNKCVTGDMELINTSPNQFTKSSLTVEELYENEGYTTPRWKEQSNVYKKMNTLSLDADGQLRPNKINMVSSKGIKEIMRLKTESGKEIKVTKNHRLLSDRGFIFAGKFKVGDNLAVNSGIEKQSYQKTEIGKGWRKGSTGGAGDFKDRRTTEVKSFIKEHAGLPCEHCDQHKKRMEAHHVTQEAPHSILEWLCSGCHKKAEYKKGRTKVWEKGFSVKFEKIVEIENAGKQKVYDISMEDSSRPTFVGNGIVNHNSHAYSYAIISYWTMYLKVNHYKEFVLANCQTSSDENKLKGILCEFVRSGHKLVPPDINLSEESFSVCEGGLRLGFSQIANFGEKISNVLAENAPYTSIFDLKKRAKLSDKKISVLKECGVINSLLNTGQVSLFGESPRDVVEGMKHFCPIVVKIEPLTEQLKWIEFTVVSTSLDNLSQTEEEKKVSIIFRINKKNIKDYFEDKESRGKKIDRKKIKRPDLNRLASLHIYDDTGRISAYVNRFTFPRCFADLMEDVEENDLYYAIGSVPKGGRIIFIEHLINLSRSSRLGEGQRLYAFEERNRTLFGEVSRVS